MLATQKVGIHDFNDDVLPVTLFTLTQWRHALKLEELGMTHSRGSVTAHVRRMLKAPARVSREEIRAHLDASWEDIMEQLEALAA